MPSSNATVITPDQFLDHWQGHRRVTRRLLEAFPEDQLFEFSIGGMRTMGEMIQELLDMSAPVVHGVLTDEWNPFIDRERKEKAYLLEMWDKATKVIDETFPKFPAERFQERANAFGMYEGPVHWMLLYMIDNEIHHRGQGYVYLRALGVEPPAFHERD